MQVTVHPKCIMHHVCLGQMKQHNHSCKSEAQDWICPSRPASSLSIHTVQYSTVQYMYATLHVCISRLELLWQLRTRTTASSSLRSLSSWRISNQLSSLFSFIIPGAKSRNTCLANLTSAELSTMAFACFLQKPKHCDCAHFGGITSREMHVGHLLFLFLLRCLFLFLLPRSWSERMSLPLKPNTFPIRQAWLNDWCPSSKVIQRWLQYSKVFRSKLQQFSKFDSVWRRCPPRWSCLAPPPPSSTTPARCLGTAPAV